MSDLTPEITPTPSTPTPSGTEAFLASVAAKTTDPLHARLLKAAGNKAGSDGLESELRAVITEIVHAN